MAGAYFAELPDRAGPPQRAPAAPGLRGGGAGRAGALDPRGRAAPAGRGAQDAADDSYELIMGERRWRASQEAGRDTIPAIVRETDDNDMLRDALLENLHRSQLNPLEEAAAYGQLLEDFGCTHEELAQRIGRSRPQISQHPAAAQALPGRPAPGRCRRAVRRARPRPAQRRRRRRSRTGSPQRVTAEGISVRGLEEIVSLGVERRGAPRGCTRRKPVAPGLADLADRLSDRFETRVKVDLGQVQGQDHRRVRQPRRPPPDRRRDGSRATAATARSEPSSPDAEPSDCGYESVESIAHRQSDDQLVDRSMC